MTSTVEGLAPCGLKYGIRRTGSPVAHCALAIMCGTRDEDSFPEGIAHFTEHVLFKGTLKKKAAVINGYLEQYGGDLNAYTSKEKIVVYATVLKEDIVKAMSLIFEIVCSSIFPEAEMEKEKGVIIDEINSYKDNPSDDIVDRFECMLFSGTPLGKPILGTQKSVRSTRREHFLAFTQKYFIASRMRFSANADVDCGRLEKVLLGLCRKYFQGACGQPYFRNGLSGGEAGVPTVGGCATGEAFTKVVDKRSHHANLVLGAVAPAMNDPRRPVMTLLADILGGYAPNSILNMKIREKHGLAYDVGCEYNVYSDAAMAMIFLGCEQGNLDKCREIIATELEKLCDAPLSASRLEKAKKQKTARMCIRLENGGAACLNDLGSLTSFGRVTSIQERIDEIRAVTSEQILSLAQQVFDPSRLCSLTYL